jgi:hypothetical protein
MFTCLLHDPTAADFPRHQADNERLQKQFQGQSDGQKLVPFSAESGQSTSMKVEHNRIQWENNLLVGGLEHVVFFIILGIIIPTDELIFFRWVAQPPTRYSIERE